MDRLKEIYLCNDSFVFEEFENNHDDKYEEYLEENKIGLQ